LHLELQRGVDLVQPNRCPPDMSIVRTVDAPIRMHLGGANGWGADKLNR